MQLAQCHMSCALEIRAKIISQSAAEIVCKVVTVDRIGVQPVHLIHILLDNHDDY